MKRSNKIQSKSTSCSMTRVMTINIRNILTINDRKIYVKYKQTFKCNGTTKYFGTQLGMAEIHCHSPLDMTYDNIRNMQCFDHPLDFVVCCQIVNVWKSKQPDTCNDVENIYSDQSDSVFCNFISIFLQLFLSMNRAKLNSYENSTLG